MAIFSIESRFHFTDGVGEPDARQRSVTFEPSRTITSLELNEKKSIKYFFCYFCDSMHFKSLFKVKMNGNLPEGVVY